MSGDNATAMTTDERIAHLKKNVALNAYRIAENILDAGSNLAELNKMRAMLTTSAPNSDAYYDALHYLNHFGMSSKNEMLTDAVADTLATLNEA